MKANKNKVERADNINPPIIHSPLKDTVYRSPVPVSLEGNGGQTAPEKYEANFHPGPPTISGTLVSNKAQFDQLLEPGPHNFDSRLMKSSGQYESNYTYVYNFYVLTPPANPAARTPDFANQVIDHYISGSSTVAISAALASQYANASLGEIASVIDTLDQDFRKWQTRALEPLFVIVYLERFDVLIGDTPVQKAVYLAVGINKAGHRIMLGLWGTGSTDAVHFWRRVMTELNNRGVQDILMLCTEDFDGVAEATVAIFPRTSVQYSIEHRVKNSLVNVPRARQKQVAADLEPIFASADVKSAEQSLRQFEKKWASDYPSIGQSLRQAWPFLTPYLGQPVEFHKIISTTDPVDTMSASLRKAIKTHAAFQSEEGIRLLIYRTLLALSPKKATAIKGWKEAINHFSRLFKGRI